MHASRRLRGALRTLTARVVALALLTALLLVGCGRREWPDDLLVLAVPTAARTLDPRLAVDAASTRIWRLVFAGLTSVAPTGEVHLALAESLTATAWDSDGEPLAVIATLRPGLRFHDGRPVEAEDVACTWRSAMDPRLGSPVAGELGRRVRAVPPLDARRVRFGLHAPLATFASDLILGIVPRSACSQPNLALIEPIGAGEFAVVDAGDLAAVRLRRVGPTPAGAARSLLIRAVSDETGRLLSVLAGGADLALGLSPLALQAATGHRGARLARAPGIAWTYLGLNTRDPAVADPRVRRALSLAVDRAALVHALLDGRGRPAPSMFPSGHWVAPPDFLPPAQDVAAAAALLDAAGLSADAAGVRLRLRLLVPPSRPRRREADALAVALRAIGVEVTVRSLELGTLLAELRAGRFQAFLLGLPEPLEPDYLGWMFHSANHPGAPPRWPEAPATPPTGLDCQPIVDAVRAAWLHDAAMEGLGLATPRGAGNRTGVADPLLDCLLAIGRRRADRTLRAHAYHTAIHRLGELVPVISLWHEDQVALVHPRVGPTTPAADGRLSAYVDAPLAPRSDVTATLLEAP